MKEPLIINVKSEEHFFELLYKQFSMGTSGLLFTLRNKGEYGIGRSQEFYQKTAATMADKIAENLGLDGTAAYVISSCREACFVSFGPVGFRLVKKHLSDNNVILSDNEIWIQYLEYTLERNEMVPQKLDRCIRELFCDENEPTIPEVKVAKFCHRAVEDIKVIERNRHMVPVCKNIVAEFSDRTVNLCKEKNALVYSDETDRLIKKINEPPQVLLLAHKERLWSALCDLTHGEFSRGLIESVFEAMWMYC